MRFVHNLLPQLAAAATPDATHDGAAPTANISRVISVLGPGNEGKLNLDDLPLKTHYSLANAAAHAITMNSLFLCELAAAHPSTSFIHSNPGAVQTNILRDFNPVLRGFAVFATRLARPLLGSLYVPLDECGERHVYAATSEKFPSKQLGKDAHDVAVGVDGIPGSGAYRLHYDSSITNQKEKLLKEYLSNGVGKKVWEHTLSVFDSIERE